MSVQKDERLKALVQRTVRELLAIDEIAHGEVIHGQCKRIATDIGNMLAPQLYDSRIHGVNNAVSAVIRSCSEALFWLDLSGVKPESCMKAVSELREMLASPQL